MIMIIIIIIIIMSVVCFFFSKLESPGGTKISAEKASMVAN